MSSLSLSTQVRKSIDQFIGDAKTILVDDGPSEEGIARLVNRMAALVRDPVILESHQQFTSEVSDAGAGDHFIDTGRKSITLYTDESGLRLVRSRFDPDEPTAIHSHSTWGVVGVYAGRDRHQA